MIIHQKKENMLLNDREKIVLAAAKLKEFWGFINTKGEWIIEPLFLYHDNGIPFFGMGYCAVKSKTTGKFGLIDIKGKWVVSPEYGSVSNFSDGLVRLVPANYPRQFRFWSVHGEMQSFSGYDLVEDFHEGFAKVKSGYYWGFIDKNGEIAIKPQYYDVHPFSNGLAAVDVGTETDERGDRIPSFLFIDNKGSVRIKSSFEFAFDFIAEYCVISDNGLLGVINYDGETVVDPKYEFYDFYSTLKQKFLIASVPGTIKKGLMDLNGRWIIEPRFTTIGEIGDSDILPVQEDGLWGYIKSNGDMLVEPMYQNCEIFQNGMGAVKINGKYGYIDQKGKIVIPNKYVDARAFSSGYASVKNENGYGVIDRGGDWIFKPKFEEIGPFEVISKLEKISGD